MKKRTLSSNLYAFFFPVKALEQEIRYELYYFIEYLRKAKIVTENGEYTVEMPFGKIVKIVTDGKTFVWPENELAEVIKLTNSEFTAQGESKEKFYIAQNGNVKECELDFESTNICKINY